MFWAVGSECGKRAKRIKILSSEDKYEAMSICTDICSLVSSCGGSQYHTRINALKSMRTLLRRGTEITVVGLDGNNQPECKALVHSLLSILFFPFLPLLIEQELSPIISFMFGRISEIVVESTESSSLAVRDRDENEDDAHKSD